MTTTLDALRVEMTISREALLQEVARVPDALFDARPSEDAWSTAEILDHLLMVDRRVGGLLAKFIEGKPDEPGHEEPTVDDVFRSVQTIFAERAAQPLKSTYVPTRNQSREALLASLHESRANFFRAIDASFGIDLRAGVFPHPVFGPLDLYQWMLFVARHEDRHCAQIARLRTTLEQTA